MENFEVSDKTVSVVTAALAGAVLTLAALTAGYAINPDAATGILEGNLKKLAVAVFVGFSTGHYLGRAMHGIPNRTVAAAIGGYATLSLAWLYLSGFSIWSLLLVLVALGVFLAYVSRLADERQDLRRYAEPFAERASPILLAVVGLVQVVMPALGMGPTARAILGGVQLGVVLAAGIAAVYAYVYVQRSRARRS